MLEIKTIKNYVLNNGGMTLNTEGEKADLKTGFMASYQNTEKQLKLNDLTNDLIKSMIKDAMSKKAYLGLWLDNEILYLDISININNLNDAMTFAKENKQLAIYDVKNAKTIYLKN